MYQTTTLRLNLNQSQKQHLEIVKKHTCWLYNRFLQHRIGRYKRTGKLVSFFIQAKLLSRLRRRYHNLRFFAQRVQLGVLQRLERAFQGFFNRIKMGKSPGFPRFKGSHYWKSFEYVSLDSVYTTSSLQIPGLGKVFSPRFAIVKGVICSLRVLHKSKGWYLQVLTKTGDPPPKVEVQTSVGIDVGLTSFAVLSNGEEVENPRFARKFEQKIRRANRSLARKKKGSNRRLKQKIKLSQLHERVKESRKNFIHHLSRKLINQFDLICCEKLQIRNMTRGHISKSILDASWGFLFWCLAYKAEKAGKFFVQVNPNGTSQLCSKCGIKVPKKLADRSHSCPNCHFETTRDHNSSLEILKRGLKIHYGLVDPEIKHAELALSEAGVSPLGI